MREFFLFYLFVVPFMILALGLLVAWVAVRDSKALDRLDAERAAREARAPAAE